MTKEHNIQANQLIAGDIFHPGEFLSDEMQARGIKQVELSKDFGLSKTESNLMMHGKHGITVPLAIKLERVFEIGARKWMNLQIKFEIDVWMKKEKKELFTKGNKASKNPGISEIIEFV